MSVHAAITYVGENRVDIAHASPHSAHALGITAVLTKGEFAGSQAMAEEILRSGMVATMVVWDGIELRIREITRAELEANGVPA